MRGKYGGLKYTQRNTEPVKPSYHVTTASSHPLDFDHQTIFDSPTAGDALDHHPDQLYQDPQVPRHHAGSTGQLKMQAIGSNP